MDQSSATLCNACAWRMSRRVGGILEAIGVSEVVVCLATGLRAEGRPF